MIRKFVNSKFKKDLSFSYIAQALTIIFGFAQLFLINKYFGVNVYGQLAIIISTAGIFSSLLTARSSEAVTRFFKREELNKKFENAKFVLFVGLGIDFITAILLVMLIYSLSHFIADTFLKDDTLSHEIIIYSLITFITFLKGSIMGYMQSKGMFVQINIINIIESAAKILFLVLFILILNKLFLIDIIYVFLISSIVSFLYTISIFLKSYIVEYKSVLLKFNKPLLKEYWSFNIKTFLSSSLKAGNENIDNMLIAYFLNAQIVGIYQIIKKILLPISILSIPFSMLIYPRLIYFFETDQKEKFKNIIIKISTYILLIGILYSLFAHVFLDDIFDLMVVEFNETYSYYYILIAVTSIITSSLLWWVRIFSNTVNPNYSLYMNLFATFYQLTITIYMTKIFGLEGLLISFMIMNMLIFVYWIKKGQEYAYIQKDI